jgi:hypothetical protein
MVFAGFEAALRTGSRGGMEYGGRPLPIITFLRGRVGGLERSQTAATAIPSQICRAPEVLHRHGVDPV